MIISHVIFIVFHWLSWRIHSIIEFNMIASPNPWNLNQIEIWIQIEAAGIRTKTNHWKERKSQTLVIKNLMYRWTFIKSQEIQYILLLKPLRVEPWPTNDHDSWSRDLISLIFFEKPTHSLNVRAGADSRASSETARPGTFQTFTFRTARAESCKRRVEGMPLRNVRETTFRKCANRQ